MSITPGFNDKQSMRQTKGTGKWTAGVAVVSLIASALLACWMVAGATAQPLGGGTGQHPVLLLANQALPPMSFMKNGKPTGLVIDLAQAMAKRMHHVVEIRLMNWAEAQQLVLEGGADALLQIDPSPERLKVYDFSQPLLNTEFTIFASAERPGVVSLSDLRGLKVGVEEKGLPMLLLQKDPQIMAKIIPNFVQGFRMLSEGTLDAVIADRWVGRYVLAENDIRGVELFDKPISESNSAIAVKKGNTDLLGDINAALADIRQDGSYDRIIKSWRSMEVVFRTREQLRRETRFIAGVSVTLIAALVGVAVLVREIRRRRRVEATLRESEERFRTLAAASFEGIAVTVDGRCVDANTQLASLLGYEPAELIGREVSSMIASADHRRVMENIESGKESSLEHDVLRKDGSCCTVEARGRTLNYKGRQVRFTVIRDITERKRAEQALKHSEERLRLFIEHAPASLAMFDGEMRYLSASRRWLSDYKLGRRGLYGISHYEVFPETPEYWKEVHRRGLAGEVVRADDDRFERIDGSVQWLKWEVRPWHGATGDVAGIVIFTEDITERKRMEDELRRSESRFKLLSETATNLLPSENPQGIVNELCRNVMAHLDCHVFFNFLVEESVGKLHLNACAGIPDEAAREIEWLDYGVAVCGCVARNRERIVAEDIFNTPDIRTELVKSYGIQAYACHPLMIQEKLVGTLSFGTKTRQHFSTDDLALMKTVTDQVAVAMERIRLIEGLRKSRDDLELRVDERTAEIKTYMAKLEESNQALQDFASIASHDMQEPLRKVISFGNMLRQAYKDSLGETGIDYLNRMLGATHRMQSLLKGLLEYSRVTTKSNPFVEVELTKVIGEVLSDLEVRIERTGGKVLVGELSVVKGDPTQMRQLFQNLIGNALKFHKEGEKPVVEVRSTLEGGKLQIVIEDNGIGFEEQFAERIFAPFQRLHGRGSPYEGTGIGLAICKKIVERHGGSITARSKPGQGSTFVITLPVKQDTDRV